MLSVIIAADHRDDALARTLASLVPAAVEGIVRDVHILGGDPSSVRRIADVSGARHWREAKPQEVVAAARAEWLLLLEPGARPQGEWMEAVADHATRSQMPASFRRERGGRMFAWFGSRRGALADGLLITKRQAMANAKGRNSLEALATGLARSRLDATIAVAP